MSILTTISQISFLQAVVILITFLIARFIYQYFVHPYLMLQYYKSQGAKAIWTRELIPLKRCNKSIQETNYYYNHYRESFEGSPKPRFAAENFLNKTQLILYDFEMVKELVTKYEIYHKDPKISE